MTVAEAAEEHQVDRATIMRIRTVAEEVALAALAAAEPEGLVGAQHPAHCSMR
ncbi:hypothetical protein [Rhodococcus koreensis]